MLRRVSEGGVRRGLYSLGVIVAVLFAPARYRVERRLRPRGSGAPAFGRNAPPVPYPLQLGDARDSVNDAHGGYAAKAHCKLQ